MYKILVNLDLVSSIRLLDHFEPCMYIYEVGSCVVIDYWDAYFRNSIGLTLYEYLCI